MIQRRQSLYLLIVAVLMGIMLFVPLGKFLGGDEEFLLKAFGIYSATDSSGVLESLPYMGILIAMSALLPFITIFFYKNRILQIRLCFMEMVFLIGVQAYVVIFLYKTTRVFKELGAATASYSLVDILPVVCLILMWMAFKAIARDEALVRSLDRIR